MDDERCERIAAQEHYRTEYDKLENRHLILSVKPTFIIHQQDWPLTSQCNPLCSVGPAFQQHSRAVGIVHKVVSHAAVAFASKHVFRQRLLLISNIEKLHFEFLGPAKQPRDGRPAPSVLKRVAPDQIDVKIAHDDRKPAILKIGYLE